MYQLLHKYFSVSKNLVLPGIGSFNISMQPAQLDFVNKTLHAPVHIINYSNDSVEADEQLYNFIANETGENKDDVINKLNSFIQELINKLYAGETLQFQNIGTLTKNDENYSFDAYKTTATLFPDVIAERVIRQNAEHSVRVGEDNKTSTQMHEQLAVKETAKEKWWISALVLAVIGIAAIVYYYYK